MNSDCGEHFSFSLLVAKALNRPIQSALIWLDLSSHADQGSLSVRAWCHSRQLILSPSHLSGGLYLQFILMGKLWWNSDFHFPVCDWLILCHKLRTFSPGMNWGSTLNCYFVFLTWCQQQLAVIGTQSFNGSMDQFPMPINSDLIYIIDPSADQCRLTCYYKEQKLKSQI